jgi:divalent metal cation (Fe/Co/Zn/Cd) transporter
MDQNATASDIELERLQYSIVSPPSMSTWSRLRDRRTRKAHHFHTTQDEHIDCLVRVAKDPAASRLLDDKQDSAFHIKAAVALSIYGTILVAGLQIYAAVTTLSLSLFVTMAESCCEAASNIGLDYLHRRSKRLNGSPRWPAGAERLGNAGNICFAFALMAVSLVLVVESIRALASPEHELGRFHVAAIVAAACGFGIKLFLAVYCFIFRKYSSQLEMLWKDNRNDCFEYGFAIFTSAAGAKLQWWVDPAGAMAIALVIMITWIGTVRSEFLELCGLGAAPSVVQEIIFITIRHSPLILKVDTAHAYHWGEDLFVEVDVVMDPERSLREVHDVSQELQDKLETVEGVARAFVHVDYGESSSGLAFYSAVTLSD